MYRNREEYNAAKVRLDSLINEATAKGMLESDMDNEYTREIGIISAEMADYEDEVLKIMKPVAKEQSSHRVSIPTSLYTVLISRAKKDGMSVSKYVSRALASVVL